MMLSDWIEQLKQETEQGKNQLLKTFEFVPDDKLNWSPSPTARTPLWIVAHCGVANGVFAAVLRGDDVPMPKDPKEASARIRESGREIQSREVAVALVDTNTAKVIEALSNVTEEMVESSPQSPFGPIPFRVWMKLPSTHMSGHASQLDYLRDHLGRPRKPQVVGRN